MTGCCIVGLGIIQPKYLPENRSRKHHGLKHNHFPGGRWGVLLELPIETNYKNLLVLPKENGEVRKFTLQPTSRWTVVCCFCRVIFFCWLRNWQKTGCSSGCRVIPPNSRFRMGWDSWTKNWSSSHRHDTVGPRNEVISHLSRKKMHTYFVWFYIYIW